MRWWLRGKWPVKRKLYLTTLSFSSRQYMMYYSFNLHTCGKAETPACPPYIKKGTSSAAPPQFLEKVVTGRDMTKSLRLNSRLLCCQIYTCTGHTRIEITLLSIRDVAATYIFVRKTQPPDYAPKGAQCGNLTNKHLLEHKHRNTVTTWDIVQQSVKECSKGVGRAW